MSSVLLKFIRKKVQNCSYKVFIITAELTAYLALFFSLGANPYICYEIRRNISSILYTDLLSSDAHASALIFGSLPAGTAQGPIAPDSG